MAVAYNDLALRFRGRFMLYASAVAGERALAQAAGIRPESAKSWSRASEMRKAFLDDCRTDVAMFLEDKTEHSDLSIFHERLTERLRVFVENLEDIAKQIERSSVREMAGGSVNLIDIVGKNSGAIKALAQRRMAQPSYMVRDTSGRKWSGEKLVYILTRDFGYQTHIDFLFADAVEEKASKVITVYYDADRNIVSEHSMSGLEIDLTVPVKEWLAIRDSTFHINSNLSVRNSWETES